MHPPAAHWRALDAGVPRAETQYELYAVVVHSGSMHGGHYVAYVRLPETSVWYYVSDTSVQRSSEADALRAQAYLLFYRQRRGGAPPPAVADL